MTSTTPLVPVFVVQMYARAIESLLGQRTTLDQACRMYGNGWRARHETAEWKRQNMARFDGDRAILRKIQENAPGGLTMADVKAAWRAAA